MELQLSSAESSLVGLIQYQATGRSTDIDMHTGYIVPLLGFFWICMKRR
jgi:hypothetical protein